MPCSQFEAAFTCGAMTDEHIARTIRAGAEALHAVAGR
jgi:glutamate-1-semialdehyde 2,1-aminomutase